MTSRPEKDGGLARVVEENGGNGRGASVFVLSNRIRYFTSHTDDPVVSAQRIADFINTAYLAKTRPLVDELMRIEEGCYRNYPDLAIGKARKALEEWRHGK